MNVFTPRGCGGSIVRKVIPGLRVDIIPITELTPEMKQRWLSVQSLNPDLSGPCFHPDLYCLVGAYSQDVYVALLYDEGVLTGFLPYLKNARLSAAMPIEFCDYQAIIGPESYPWDLKQILKEMDLRSWRYEFLADFEHIRSKGWQLKVCESQRIDLIRGYEDYICAGKDGTVKFGGLGRKEKMAESCLGPLRFVPRCSDPEALRQLVFWKSSQYHRDLNWIKLASRLVEYFCFSKQSSIDGALSALYAGDEILAVFFGLKYQRVLHALMCSFNPDRKKFSPGLMLWRNVIRSHDSLQYRFLDFGPGENKYKSYFANCALPVMRQNCTETAIKEKIKSVKWLNQGLCTLRQKLTSSAV